jgi:hypothetical protein
MQYSLGMHCPVVVAERVGLRDDLVEDGMQGMWMPLRKSVVERVRWLDGAFEYCSFAVE